MSWSEDSHAAGGGGGGGKGRAKNQTVALTMAFTPTMGVAADHRSYRGIRTSDTHGEKVKQMGGGGGVER